MEYSIGEFSRKTGLGIHTLRYYEHEGLLLPERTAANRRRYSERDVAWAAFLLRLKETGMPIREIRRYATLRAEGDSTLLVRMEMLTAHHANLAAELDRLHAHMEALDAKIAFYCEAIEEHGKE
ncbi:MAG: MerR family transcriptional regulator [Selenomonas sp.]|nr:MerR family transcriptional regulator [Selenomonas sp.]